MNPTSPNVTPGYNFVGDPCSVDVTFHECQLILPQIAHTQMSRPRDQKTKAFVFHEVRLSTIYRLAGVAVRFA
jgi:hypothetical protein